MGHYVGNFLMMDQFTDAHLHLTVLPLAGLSIDGKNVINILSLSLLEALQGCQKEVPTIKGSRTIIVPPASRHKEEVSLPNLGVSGKGDQKVVLHVAYPNDLDSLKVFLETLCPSQ
jgi:DnaJ-class molecular chaperone